MTVTTRAPHPPKGKCAGCGAVGTQDWHCENPRCLWTCCRECGAVSNGMATIGYDDDSQPTRWGKAS